MEIWKKIEGFETYSVSTMGNVRNDKTDKILKLGYTGKYHQVVLCLNGKHHCFTVHRLVALAFIPNPNNLSDVNHKDENPSNNCVDNLEWLSRKDNNNYGTRNHRISGSMKGKQNTKGKPKSDETKKKMSEAKKRYYENKKLMCENT